MLFTFNKNTKKIDIYPETDFKTHDIKEKQDIEKWVEENPEILLDDLLIITTEYDGFDKTNERLDLLAIDRDGVLVVVELKRDDSGKTAELQALKYAAYCSNMTMDQLSNIHRDFLNKKGISCSEEDAGNKIKNFIVDPDFTELNGRPRIILVSREYSKEVTASVMWLLKFGIDIRCVKITPYVLDNQKIALVSNILIPVPEAKEFIIQAEKKEEIEHNLSLRKEEYKKFWKDLALKFQPLVSLKLDETWGGNYFQVGNTKSIHFEWVFHRRPMCLGVELHFESNNRDTNLRAIDSILSQKDDLERKLGESITVEKEYRQTWARIYISKEYDENITEELKVWAVEKMKIFYDVLQPAIDKLKK